MINQRILLLSTFAMCAAVVNTTLSYTPQELEKKISYLQRAISREKQNPSSGEIFRILQQQHSAGPEAIALSQAKEIYEKAVKKEFAVNRSFATAKYQQERINNYWATGVLQGNSVTLEQKKAFKDSQKAAKIITELEEAFYMQHKDEFDEILRQKEIELAALIQKRPEIPHHLNCY